LTDIARHKDSERTDYIIQNWMRSRNTIEFLGIWEKLNNPAFNPIEFDGIRKQAGLNSFVLTARQWIAKAGAIGIVSQPGRYGGTFAHKDIAFEFASWISTQGDRLRRLNAIAIRQMQTLTIGKGGLRALQGMEHAKE
jgi:hypothetical protein